MTHPEPSRLDTTLGRCPLCFSDDVEVLITHDLAKLNYSAHCKVCDIFEPLGWEALYVSYFRAWMLRRWGFAQ